MLLLAPVSGAPAIPRTMGAALLIGLTFPFLGADSAKARIDWEAQHTTFLRMERVLFAWAGLAVYTLSVPRNADRSTTPPNTSLECRRGP